MERCQVWDSNDEESSDSKNPGRFVENPEDFLHVLEDLVGYDHID